MRLLLSLKINGIIIIVVTVILLGFGGYKISQTWQKLNQELDTTSTAIAERLSLALAGPMWSFDDDDVWTFMHGEMQNDNVLAIEVKRSTGDVTTFMTTRNDDWQIEKITESKPIEGFIQKEQDISKDNEDLGIVTVYMSDRFITKAYRTELQLLLIQTVLLLAFIVLTLFVLIEQIIIKPVKNLTQVSSIIAQGNLDEEITIYSSDEIGMLAGSFDTMRHAIKQQIVVLNDEIHERKRAETEVRELNEHLEERVEQRTKELHEKNELLEHQAEVLQTQQAKLEEYTVEIEAQASELYDAKQVIELALAETETLYTISQQMVIATSLTDLIAALVENVNIPEINRAILIVFEYDEHDEPEAIVIEATWYSGYGTEPSTIGTRLSREIFTVVNLMISPEPIFIENIQTDERTDQATVVLTTQLNIKAMAILPLYSHACQIGSLMLEGEEPYLFEHEKIKPVLSMLGQLAIAVENRRLFQQVQERAIALAEANEIIETANHELTQTLEELRTTQKQLVESEKMASLGGLVAGIAHEINTPVGLGVTIASTLNDETLSFIKAYKKSGLKRSTLNAYLNRTRQSCSMILENLQRAADLVQNFKQVAVDQSSLEKRAFHVRDYIERTVSSLGLGLHRTGHAIEYHGDDAIQIESYPGSLAQVLTNLITNSINHAYQEDEYGHMQFHIEQDDEHVKIIYQDDGCGMDDETLSKIFEPFFTTARSKGGTGLGMHIVYNLVTQKLGGTIDVTSQVGHGTSFIITIPKDVS